MQFVRDWYWWIPRRVLVAFSESTVIDGVRVVNVGAPEETARRFRQVARAIETIGRGDPPSLGRVRERLRMVVVVPYPGSSYWRALRACALSSTTLDEQDMAWVASVIVHEATHARISDAGVIYSLKRWRVEKACVAAQRRFLARLPDTEALLQHLDNLEAHGKLVGGHQGLLGRQLASLGLGWITRRR